MMPSCPAASTPTPDDTATALPPGYRQALRWRAHLPPRQPMVCTLHPSLSLVLSTVTALVDILGLMVYPSASRHASSMPRDHVLGSTRHATALKRFGAERQIGPFGSQESVQKTGQGVVADLDGHRRPEHMVDLAFRLRRQQRPNRVRLGSTQPLPTKPQSKAEHPQVRQAQAAEVLPINLYVAPSIIEVY